MSDRVPAAVFLSYASQDAEAVRRIAEALRTAGVEVWFDQNELVGGDAWDTKIRRQIKECALFLPIISANTQARLEGYFRLEWKLATQRMQTMAEAKPFLLPLVIDATRDAEAHVPEEFRGVQWTRLPDAVATPKFVEQVKRLLAPPSAPVSRERPANPPAPVIPPKPAGRGWIGAVAAVVLVLGVAAFLFTRKSAAPAAAASFAGEKSSAAEKSVAVLPFVNMSADKDNEFLSDGITEEILNALAKVPGLRVPARTSSFVFKGKTDDIKKIGDLLGVKTVLEGSVQRAGNQLKVTAQLINVADGYHLWSETYVQEMTNIFTIEETIARNIVEHFKVTLAGASAPKQRSDNVEAYELVLRGKFHTEKMTESELNQAVVYFQRALEKQPDYPLAHGALAYAYLMLHYRAYVSPVENTPRLRAAVAKTLELDDSLADGHFALATLLFYVDRDWSAAEREFKRAIELNPALVLAHTNYAFTLASRGRLAEACNEAAKAAALDPLSADANWCVGWAAFWSGNNEGALAAGGKLLGIAPDIFTSHYFMGYVLFRFGKQAEGIAQMEEARRIAPAPEVLGVLGKWYGRAGRRAEAQRVLDELLASAKQRYIPSLAIANVYDGLGDIEQCNAYYVKAITEREGRTVFANISNDDITRANPHFPEWIKLLGLDK